MLELTGVTVRYGATTAVDGVSLAVAPGERLALLGPSGSGKSTLLRAVAGLEPLAAGRISWNGKDLAGVPVHERHFGLMFQDYVLFPQRDVRGNVAFGPEMRGESRAAIQQRVDEALELVGLGGYGRRRITQLSGGEQQRVALARALAPTPRLLMLDEPLGALDRTLRSGLLDELAALFTRLDLPIVYVTHDQEEALAIADRVAVMRDGRFEAIATPAALWGSPPNEFIARFLGFGNISAYERDGGLARTAWGDIRIPRDAPATGRLLIRPDGLRPDPSGPIEGTVIAATFRGDHTRLVVAPAREGAPALEVDVRGAPAPHAGEAVRLDAASESVVVLAPGEGPD